MRKEDRGIVAVLGVVLVGALYLVVTGAKEICSKGTVVSAGAGAGGVSGLPRLWRVVCDPEAGKKPFSGQHVSQPPPGAPEAELAWVEAGRFTHIDEAEDGLVEALKLA